MMLANASFDRVEVLRTADQFEQVRDFWLKHQRHRDAHIALHRFYATSLPGRPHVLALYRSDVLKVLLVGRYEERGEDIRIGYFRLFRPTLRTFFFCRGGVLGDPSPADCKLLVDSVIATLRDGEADHAIFSQLDMSSPLYNCAISQPSMICSDPIPVRNVTRSHNVGDSSRPFLSALSRNARSQHRRKEKHLKEAFNGKVEVRRFETPSDIQRLMEDCESIARMTHVRALGRGFGADSAMHALLSLAASLGWFRGYVLYLDEKPAAFWIGAVYQGVFYSDALGYDPAFAPHSPGLYLIIKAMEDATESRHGSQVSRFEFGPDTTGYKIRFCNEEGAEATIQIFAPRLRLVCINAVRMVTTAINETAKHLLLRLGLISRVNHIWAERMAARRDHSEHL